VARVLPLAILQLSPCGIGSPRERSALAREMAHTFCKSVHEDEKFKPGCKDTAREIREYFIPDFSRWKDYEFYQSAFERLVRDLRSTSAGR
jgi:hypothetical protein